MTRQQPNPATASPSASALLRADNVSLVYSDGKRSVQALSGLDFEIPRGQFLSIVGPSGCGKSSFLRIVAGLQNATSGRIIFADQTVQRPRPGIGMVFQKPNLFPWKTVLKNATIQADVLGLNRIATRQRATSLLQSVGLSDFTEAYPRQLSGGMQQRVGIVRALVPGPELLLMDEPFSALDAMTREQISDDLQRLWAVEHKTVVFVTHSIPEAIFLSDRIMIMSARPGRIVDELRINLPRPRTLESMASPEFTALCGQLRARFMQIENARGLVP